MTALENERPAVDAVGLLEDLIGIRSVNPLLSEHPDEDGEQEIATFIADLLSAAGISVELQPVDGDRVNVIGHLPRTANGPEGTVLLTAHLDTYPTYGPRSAYAPVYADGLLYGRGSADNKGSLAAMLAAFIDAANAPEHREAYVVGTCDEECLLAGVYALAKHGMAPDLAITGEPSELIPIVKQKGIIRGWLTVKGPKAHAAYPRGNSAISAVARVVSAIDDLNEALASQPDPDLGPSTLSVTKVETDGGMNLVAKEARIYFDGRFVPPSTGREYSEWIAEQLTGVVGDEIELELAPLTFISPTNATDIADPLTAGFFAHVERGAGTCEPDVFSYGSEAGVLAQFAKNALVFGPGNPGYSHAPEELIDPVEVRVASGIFYDLLTS